MGNKWKEFPQGGNYVRRFPGDVDKDLIEAEQMVFVRELMVELLPGD